MDTADGPLTPDQVRTLLARLASAPTDVACPRDDQLRAYVTGDLPSDERALIEAHLATCESCAEDVERWRGEWWSLFAAEEPDAEDDAFQDMLRPARVRRGAVSSDDFPRAVVRAKPAVGEIGTRASLGARRAPAMAWLTGRAVPALAAALVACAGLSVYLAGRLSERSSAAERRLAEVEAAEQVRMTMLETIRALSEWRVAVERGGEGFLVAASMRRVDLVQLPRPVGAPFPLMAVSRVVGDVSTLGTRLDRDPALRSEYDDYLRRLSDTLPALSDVLVQTGKVEQARILLEFLRREHPDDPGNWYGEAEMYKLGQNQRAALTLYQEMIQQDVAPGDPRPYHYAGYSAFLLGNFEAALDYYGKALAIAPRYAKVYYNKAVLYQRMPGLAPAERARLYEENWQHAFALTQEAYAGGAESNPRVVFTLAILYAVRPGGSNLDRALIFLERAIRQERTYRTRAQGEPAFSSFRDLRNEPFYSRFQNLLEKYRSRSGPLDALRGPYDPDVFIE